MLLKKNTPNKLILWILDNSSTCSLDKRGFEACDKKKKGGSHALLQWPLAHPNKEEIDVI